MANTVRTTRAFTFDAQGLGPAALARRLKVRLRAHMSRRFCGVLQALAHSALDPYRPEQHYMRGPGPKWRAKNG